MFAAVNSTSSVGIGYPLAIGVTSSGNFFRLNGSRANRTFLVLTAIFGASGVSINNPLAVGVARRNVVLCYKRFATNGTMLTFGLAVRGASSGYSGINYFNMTEFTNGCLSYNHLVTNRAMLTLGFTFCSTSGSNSIIYDISVSKCRYALCLFFTTSTISFVNTVLGTICFFSCCPLAKCVNVRLGLIVALIGSFVGGFGFFGGF